MTTYTYVLTDFTSLAGASVDANVIKLEVAAAIVAPALRPGRAGLKWITDVADPTFQFDFDGTLSAGEETDLDNVVAAHLGFFVLPVQGSTYWHWHRWSTTVSTKIYLPWEGNTESSTITAQSQRGFLPGPFRLLRILAYITGADAMDSTIFGLHINSNTTAQDTVTVDMAAIDTPYEFDFRRKDNLTVEGQAVALSCDPAVDPDGDVFAISMWGRAEKE